MFNKGLKRRIKRLENKNEYNALLESFKPLEAYWYKLIMEEFYDCYDDEKIFYITHECDRCWCRVDEVILSELDYYNVLRITNMLIKAIELWKSLKWIKKK